MNGAPCGESLTVRGEWSGGLDGRGTISTGAVSICVAAGSDREGSTSPAALIMAGASMCFALTLSSVLQSKRIKPVRVIIETAATFSGTPPFIITQLRHRPVVTVESNDQLLIPVVSQCFELARQKCPATHTLGSVRIVVEGVVSMEREIAGKRDVADVALTEDR